MGSRRLIINADDFGFSDRTVEATVECFKAGILSSATLMANMPAFDKAAAFALEHPEFSYGVHLCLTDEYPLSDPSEIPTLVDSRGYFWPTREFAKRAFAGRVYPRHVYREVLAQLTRTKRAGIEITHVDAHGHVHKIPVVFWALRSLFKTSGVSIVRRMQDLFYRKPRLSQRWYNDIANLFIQRLGRTTDHFLMVAGVLCQQDNYWWRHCVEQLPEGVTEIGIHPGWDEPWRRLDTLPVMESGRTYLEQHEIELISFKKLGQA